MNSIRLAVFALAALCFSYVDVSDASAQGPDPDQMRAASEAMSRAMAGRGKDNGKKQDASDDSNRGRSSSGNRSRRNNSRSNRGNDNDNAILNNPLFQLLDENGDGELSLEEIDAASRIMYSLDANEDDRITADEVADMGFPGANDRGRRDARDDDDDDEEMDRGRRSNRGRSNDRNTAGGRAQPASGPPVGDPRGEQAGGRRRPANPKFEGMMMGMDGRGGGTPAARGSGTPAGRGIGGPPGRGGVARRGGSNNEYDFDSSDRNGDGILKRGELPKDLRNDFRKIDTNRDGDIDEDEFEDYVNG